MVRTKTGVLICARRWSSLRCRMQSNMEVLKMLALAMCVLLLAVATHAQGRIDFSDSFASAGFKAPLQIADGSLLGVRTEAGTLKCFRSTDFGKTWPMYSTIATDDTPHADIGDGHLIMLANGDILYSYRQNHLHGLATRDKLFSIKIAVSSDGGKSWRHHSTVAAARGTDFGLWSSFLLEKRNGELQCYYDDERSPSLAGLERHQWISMRTYNLATGKWENPITVSRATGLTLSRDGMCSVVEVLPEHLVCVCEGVQETPPHRGCLWIVDSKDGGKTGAVAGSFTNPRTQTSTHSPMGRQALKWHARGSLHH